MVFTFEGALPFYPVPENKYDRLLDSYLEIKKILNSHGKEVELSRWQKIRLRTDRWFVGEVKGSMLAKWYVDIERPDHNPKKGLVNIERAEILVGNTPRLHVHTPDYRDGDQGGLFLSCVVSDPYVQYTDRTFVLNNSQAAMYRREANPILYAEKLGDTGAVLKVLPPFLGIATKAFQAKTEGKILRVNYQEFFK